MPSLTSAATAAVKNWTVNPATLNEKKLDATLVVAFVFRAPINSTALGFETLWPIRGQSFSAKLRDSARLPPVIFAAAVCNF